MKAVELLLGRWCLCLLLLGTRREETSLLMKLLSKWINIIEERLVLAKTWGTLGRPDKVITAPGDKMLKCTGSRLVRWRGHRLGGCVDIYRVIRGEVRGVAERVDIAGGEGRLSTACIRKRVECSAGAIRSGRDQVVQLRRFLRIEVWVGSEVGVHIVIHRWRTE